MARAEALKARTFYQPVGPGELEIPAIRGVGGSLLYFLEEAGKNWDLDFEPVRSDAGADRLDAVDHISQSMPYDEMLSWLLFYTGILDLKRLPQMEIADPVGLVQSQALINADESLRVVLNGSSADAHAVGPLHPRILRLGRAARRVLLRRHLLRRSPTMRARGADFLKIPDNYYDDIEAKYGLDAATMARCATTRSSTTAKATASSSRSTPTPSTSASSSRSWSDVTITASAPPTPRSGWRRRPVNRDR